MEIRFGAILYFQLGNENSDAGHNHMFKRAAFGPQAPQPWLKGPVQCRTAA